MLFKWQKSLPPPGKWHLGTVNKIAFLSNRRQMDAQKNFCGNRFLVKEEFLMAFCSALK